MAQNDVATTALVYDARGAAAGARDFEQASSKILQANAATVQSTERVQTALDGQQRALERLYRQIDPAYQAQRKLEQGQETLDRAYQKGAISATEYATRLEQLKLKYGQVGAAVQQSMQAIEAANQSYVSLKGRMDPTARAYEAINAEAAALDTLLKAGRITIEEHGNAMAFLAGEIDKVSGKTAQLAAIEAARAQQAAQHAQHTINQQFGIGAPATNPASVSAAVFEEAARNAEKEAQALAMLQAKAQGLKDTVAPLSKAQRVFALAVADADVLLAKGLITYEEHALAVKGYHDALVVARQAANDQGETAAVMAGKIKLSYQSTVELKAAGINLAQSLAAGMSPMTALTTQAGQAAPALLELAKNTGLSTAAMIGIGAPLAATAVAVGAGLVLWARYASSQHDVQNALRLTGNAIGMSRDQMAAFAEDAARASGLSVASARSMVTEYTKLGGVAPSVMSGLIGLTKDYAAATGTSADEASQALGGLFKDPARGAQDLAAKIGLLSGAQLDYVRRLAEAGQKTQAQSVLIEALGQRIKGAAENTSFWARTWDAVGRAASDAANRVGRAIDEAANGMSLDRQLEKAQERLAKLRKEAGSVAYSNWFGEYDSSGKAINTKAANQGIAATEQEIASLRERIRERNRLAAVQGVAANNNDASRAALEVSSRYNELGESIRKANADLAILRKGLGTNMGEAAAQAGKTVDGLTSQIADLTKVQASGYDLATYKSLQLAKVEQQAAGMLGPAREKFLAQKRAEIEAFGTATTAAQRNAQVQAAVTQVTASQAAAIAQQNAQMSVSAQYTLSAASAYLKAGEAAGIYAETLKQAKQEELSTGVPAEQRARQLMAEKAAQTALSGAQQVPQMEREASARRKIADASMHGIAAQQQAELAYKVEQATLTERLDLVNANAETESALRDVIERKTKAVIADDAAQRKARSGAILQGQDEQIATLTKERELLLATAEQRAVGLALLQAELQLHREGIDVQGAYGQKILANAEKLARMGTELDRLNQISQVFDNAFDRVGDAVTQAFVQGGGAAVNFRTVASGALVSVAADLLKIATITPFKNWVLGGVSSLFGGGVSVPSNAGMAALANVGSKFHSGGVVGQGGSSAGPLPAALWQGAPRYHTGGLAGDEVPAILQRGEEVLTVDDPRHRFNLGAANSNGPISINMPITVNANGGTQEQNADLADQIGRAVGDQLDARIVTVLRQQMRPMGLLNGGSR